MSFISVSFLVLQNTNTQKVSDKNLRWHPRWPRFQSQGSCLLNFPQSQITELAGQQWRQRYTGSDRSYDLEQGAGNVCLSVCLCVSEWTVSSQLECDWLTLIRSAAGAPIVTLWWTPASPTVISTGKRLLHGLRSDTNTQQIQGHTNPNTEETHNPRKLTHAQQ